MDEVRKNTEHLVPVEGCTCEGLGVSRIGGLAVFVQYALPG